MDAEALTTFLAVHRAGGFSRAAERLHRSQPAISRRIALLEAELGAPLFDRGAAGISLSQAGRVLLPYAERALAALEDARAAVRALASEQAGPVQMAVVGTLASTALSRVLQAFAQTHPDVDFRLRTATSAEVSELVRIGEADLGLRYHADASSDLAYQVIGREPLVVACTPAHPLAGARVPGLADLKAERWLAFPDVPTRREFAAAHIFALFLARGLSDVAWTAVDSLTAQKRLAEAGFGLALVPASSIAEELAAGALATIAVADLEAAQDVVAVTRRDGFLSAAARRLLVLLEESYRA
ncbi:LysR family transcriptional regulator [Phenylobacterium terrae]|uniref:LysR family transcriptional regulator n=1 Tax=Phenylobacterium terrae TaxID=2665495 RepID=A0ABW4N3M2_9CAUL